MTGFKSKKAAAEAKVEPPAWWPAVENILKEYGLQAIDFVADFKEAIAEAEKPRLDRGRDYEEGFVDGMQRQMQLSVDKAVNAEAEKQEPVAWMHPAEYKTHFTTIPSKDLITNGYWIPLYTSPPQRQWKEPTFDEQVLIAYASNGDVFKAIDITCAELKGMNYGQEKS